MLRFTRNIIRCRTIYFKPSPIRNVKIYSSPIMICNRGINELPNQPFRKRLISEIKQKILENKLELQKQPPSQQILIVIDGILRLIIIFNYSALMILTTIFGLMILLTIMYHCLWFIYGFYIYLTELIMGK